MKPEGKEIMKKYTKQEVATHLCFNDIITPMNLLRSEWIADPTLAEAWAELLAAKARVEKMLKKELTKAAKNRPWWHFC